MEMLKGAITALITPFTDNGELDEEGLRFLIQRQIKEAIDGIVLMGSTGESPTITSEEQKRILEIGHEECRKRCRLIAGTGSNSTAHTIENTLAAERAGADAALVVTPYYIIPTQEGIYRHFSSIAAACSLPLLIYNHPKRAGQHISLDTLKRLMQIPTIAGFKDCSGSILYASDVVEAARQCRHDFSIFTGDDPMTLPMMAVGGHGVISVAANLLPKEIVGLVREAGAGDREIAQRMHHALMPLIRALFIETNPIPVKAAMQLSGLPSGGCRLPLTNASEETIELLKGLL